MLTNVFSSLHTKDVIQHPYSDWGNSPMDCKEVFFRPELLHHQGHLHVVHAFP